MALNNIVLLGAGLVALVLAWPYISKKLANLPGASDMPVANVPELGGQVQYRHTTVQGPSAPSMPSGFRHASVKGSGRSAPSMPSGFRRSGVKAAGTQGNCQFTGPSTVCWASGGATTCNTFNAKSSDVTSVSGRQTLCSRVRAKHLAQHKGSQSLSYVGQRIGVA